MTTTTDTAATPAIAAERPPRARVLLATFLGGLLVVVVAAGAGLYAYDRTHAGLIMHGVRVGSVDLSDLGRDTAALRLQAAYPSLSAGHIVVRVAGTSTTIPYSALGRAPAIEQLLNEAFAVGRTGNIAEQALDEVRAASRGVAIEPEAAIDPDAIAREVQRLAANMDRAPIDAVATATATGYTSSQPVDGRSIDQAAAVAAITKALAPVDAPAETILEVGTVRVAPAVSAEDANVARARAAAMAQPVSVVDGKETWVLPVAVVRSWIAFGGTGASYGPIVNTGAVQASLAPLSKQIRRTAKDATFLVGKGSSTVVGVTASVTGRSLDVPSTADRIVAQLGGGSGAPVAAPIQAALVLTQPKLTTEVAQQSAPLMRRISSWTTYYISGAHNGFSANISLPAMAIDGTIVAPGQWFSFWKTVGEVSAAKGYKLGGAIIQGHSVEGKTIGGGICSCSTTIFNAALRAGFQMGARRNHYYYISRYPMGLDATVYKTDGGGVVDMTWRNDTPYPVLIRAHAVPGIVTFTLYSVPTGRTVSFSPPTVKNYLPSTTVVQYTTALRPGRSQQVEYRADGFDCWVTRTVRDKNGAIVHQETYYSHYARVVGVILVGKRAA